MDYTSFNIRRIAQLTQQLAASEARLARLMEGLEQRVPASDTTIVYGSRHSLERVVLDKMAMILAQLAKH